MDTHRLPLGPAARRVELERVPTRAPRRTAAQAPSAPIRIGSNVWVGFDACVLPGVSIGDGAVIGARSVVAADVTYQFLHYLLGLRSEEHTSELQSLRHLVCRLLL